MPAASELSRRGFLQAGAAAAGGLLLSFHLAPRGRAADAAAAGAPDSFAPNAFVRIARDGRVTVIVDKAEVGQGVYTSLPMLVAEELEIGLDQVTVEPAPPDDKLYADPILRFEATGNSTSVRGSWERLRHAGATAKAMLIQAAAQRWQVDPSTCRAERGAVLHPPSGRKLGYGELVDAAALLPVPAQAPLKDPKDFTLIGTSPLRLDLPGKVNGQAQYGIDLRLPGMKIATVAACPVFGGKVVNVDDSDAKKIPGVSQIVRLDNAVAVVADHMWAAKQGLDALYIDWDEGANAKTTMRDIVQQLEAAAQRPGLVARQDGDVEKALAGAATRVDATYQDPFLSHAPLEPMNCLVHVHDGACEVWTATQVQARAQAAAAAAAGVPLDKVTINNQLAGGAFGRRLETDGVTQAVRIAKEVGAPVKLVWTREEDIRHDLYRPYYHDRISAGLDAKGMPVAWRHRIVGSSVMARFAPPALRKDGLDPDAVDCAAQPPYAFPNILVDYVPQEPPGIPTAFWRGVGPTHNVFVMESFIDELAASAKQDPVDYRRALLGPSPRAKATLDLAAEKAGWGKPLPRGSGRGVAVVHVFDSYLTVVAELTVPEGGEVRLDRIVAAVDCGMVVHPDTVRAQIEGGILFGLTAALFDEITIANGRVEQSNFNDYRTMRMNEAPPVEVYIVKSAEPPGGIGETGTVGAAPALTNAIFAATGTRIRQLPVKRTPLRSA